MNCRSSPLEILEGSLSVFGVFVLCRVNHDPSGSDIKYHQTMVGVVETHFTFLRSNEMGGSHIGWRGVWSFVVECEESIVRRGGFCFAKESLLYLLIPKKHPEGTKWRK